MQNEGLIATANGFKSQQGTSRQLALRSLTPGMMIEIPAPRYLRVQEGQTWKSLAERWLGAEKRAFVLADMNGFKPWHEPEAGQLIVLPYPLAWLSNGTESLASLSYRYLGSTKYAYRLMQFNDLKKERPERGQIILLPLVDLTLTEAGQAAALRAASMLQQQSDRSTKKQQDEAAAELRKLQLKLDAGQYAQVVAGATRILTQKSASRTTEARVHHALLIAAVALESTALARESCEAMRQLAPDTQLLPLYTSPKILKVCPNPEQNDEHLSPR